MKKNVGTIDKIIRIVIAVIIVVLIVLKLVTGTFAIVLAAVGAILLVTSLISFCGLYTLFGFNTCPAKKTD